MTWNAVPREATSLYAATVHGTSSRSQDAIIVHCLNLCTYYPDI
ncbi:uncharacterized protein CPUR_04599 [Claviceps purpurea 20.1]|uniref:Uncharacterized protein n=1 Tax=Claviceps purpurea (strain 20.1) TaxID=1111077 RepID=M1W6W9_CLAP2|nr:uncharacterized protein CPUR_04599 [Claviceps purpurea 20.1]